MINTAGAYLLIIVYTSFNAGGLAVHEVNNFETCQAALTQLDPISHVYGYCIAVTLED
jgi:hypothetical protein